MRVVLFNHWDAGSHLKRNQVNISVVVIESERCVCVPQTVEDSFLSGLRVNQKIVILQEFLEHLLKTCWGLFPFRSEYAIGIRGDGNVLEGFKGLVLDPVVSFDDSHQCLDRSFIPENFPLAGLA